MDLTHRLGLVRRRLPHRTVHVRVKGGYHPSVVHGRVGEPLRIVFLREETASASEHVVFPAFGKNAMLPSFEDVAVELLPDRAGDFEFTSHTGALRGRLAVTDGGPTRQTQAAPSPIRARLPRWRTAVAGEYQDTLLLTFVAWLCALPLLLLVTVPVFGWKAGAVLALVSFGVAAAACIFVCARRVPARRRDEATHT